MIVKGSNNSDYQQVEPGTYLARCIKVIDIGTHESEFQGKPVSRRQVVLEWELPTEEVTQGEAAGRPLTIRKFYTASLGDKANLRHDLVTWRGRDFTPEELAGFDLGNILGIPCMLTVTETETGRRKVSGVAKLPKGMEAPAQINPSILFDLDDFDSGIFADLSDWFKETISQSPEYQALSDGGFSYPCNPDGSDATPF